MKKILWSCLLLFTSFSITAQRIITKKIESKELQATRNLKIYVPQGYKKDTANNFPLAIVIDETYLFNTYVANAKLFAITDKAPRQIVVGINIDKTRNQDTALDEYNHQLTASNIQFLKFIRNEILPYMEANYRTSPFVTIAGQNNAANIVTAFLKEPEPLFNAYLAINPNYPPNITKKIESYQLFDLDKNDNTYYYYINKLPFSNKKKNSILSKLKVYASSLTAKNFNFILDEMNSPSYISASSEAIPRAMDKIFEKYAGITKKEYEEKIKNMLPSEAITYLEEKYLDIDFLFGANLGIREKDIYAIEDVIIDKEDGHYLRDFGEMILNVYPKSHIGDYYVGLWYEKKGDLAQALDSYRKGYGKMSDSDPKKDLFYSNIERIGGR